MVDPITIAGMGLSALSSIYGAVQANKNRKEAEQLLETQKQDLKEWRDRELAGDYLQRADSQAMLRNVKEQSEEYLQGMTNDVARSGMTDEAKVAMAQKANKAYADAAAQLAGVGQQHKDNVETTWQTQKNEFDKMKIANLMDTTATQNMVSGLGNALSAYGSIMTNTATTTTTPSGVKSPNILDTPAGQQLYSTLGDNLFTPKKPTLNF